jgi:hypothetical protein
LGYPHWNLMHTGATYIKRWTYNVTSAKQDT